MLPGIIPKCFTKTVPILLYFEDFFSQQPAISELFLFIRDTFRKPANKLAESIQFISCFSNLL
jgi:hypothetical protein